MSKTSAKVKARWNAANYDIHRMYLKKGVKEQFKISCEAAGVSMNSVLTEAVMKFIEEHPVPED